MSRANCCSRSVWLRASMKFGSIGRGRNDAITHAERRISTQIYAQGLVSDGRLTEREDKADTEQQNLPILAAEESGIEIMVERRSIPNAISHPNSLICTQTWCLVAV
jgi:hypothetical protein